MWKSILKLVPAGIFLLIICNQTGRDEVWWQWARAQDNAKSYASYRQAWPKGRHYELATERHDDRSWAEAQQAKSYASYRQAWPKGRHYELATERHDDQSWAEAQQAKTFETYIRDWPYGKHATAALEILDEIYWQTASTSNTFASYSQYLEQIPSGNHRSEARSKQRALLNDEGVFSRAKAQASRVALEQFLAEYPGHKNSEDAREALKAYEGNIVDLLNAQIVEVKSKGNGIDSVEVEIRVTVDHEIVVHFPVGTFFVCHNSSAQNMVTTQEEKVVVTKDWTTISVSVACANRPKAIPHGNDQFDIQVSPQQAELQQLMPVLRQESQSSSVRQAAVWIVTDDADYGDLGILVASLYGFGGSRVIQETEAAQAMRICEKAGIDITSMAIWGDSEKILAGLKDEALRQWLQQKLQESPVSNWKRNLRQTRPSQQPPQPTLGSPSSPSPSTASPSRRPAQEQIENESFQYLSRGRDGTKWQFRIRMKSAQAIELTEADLCKIAESISNEPNFVVWFYLPHMQVNRNPWAIATRRGKKPVETTIFWERGRR